MPAPSLSEAVADICGRFYNARGEPVGFAGSDRLIATPLDTLRKIPVTIAVAVGTEKVAGLIAGARADYFNRLVTDSPTASLLLAATADD